jgi:hypothetical protein
MALVELAFYNGGVNIRQGDYFYNWADAFDAIDELRGSNTFDLWCQNLSETEFQVIAEIDDTFTLKRKHYVNEVFDSYVTVESGLASMLATVDRIHLIYQNGTPGHQAAIAALSISGQALEPCI